MNWRKHKKHILQANQMPITHNLDIKLLHRLEQRACRRLNYFTLRVKNLMTIIDEMTAKGEHVYATQINALSDTMARKEFWDSRLDEIHCVLTERILLENNTDSK